MCSSQTGAGPLPGAEGPDDEGGTDQRLHLPPRGTHLLQAGTRQGSQAGTTFLLLAYSHSLILLLPVQWLLPYSSHSTCNLQISTRKAVMHDM